MIATLIATLFTGAAILAVGVMILSWREFGCRFSELRAQLRATNDPVMIRYTWRDKAPRHSAVVYNLDFKAKADGLPFHPERRPELLAAA